VTPIDDSNLVKVKADFIEREVRLHDLTASSKVEAVSHLYKYLSRHAERVRKEAGLRFDIEDRTTGTALVLRGMRGAIRNYRSGGMAGNELHPLD
jgi:hypothetical protein